MSRIDPTAETVAYSVEVLAAAGALEAPHLARVPDTLAARAWLVPWTAER